jgi:hypothetical protein
MHVMAEIYNRLGLYIHCHHRQIHCNQLGLCIDECISLSRLMSTVVSTIGFPVGLTVGSMVGSMVGSKVGSTVGSTVSLTWLCWTINLSKALDSSDERLNDLVI